MMLVPENEVIDRAASIMDQFWQGMLADQVRGYSLTAADVDSLHEVMQIVRDLRAKTTAEKQRLAAIRAVAEYCLGSVGPCSN